MSDDYSKHTTNIALMPKIDRYEELTRWTILQLEKNNQLIGEINETLKAFLELV